MAGNVVRERGHAGYAATWVRCKLMRDGFFFLVKLLVFKAKCLKKLLYQILSMTANN